MLLAGARHQAVYDFGNFDPRLNQMRYDAQGAPELAKQVASLLAQAGQPAHVLDEGGLDHGIWTALRYIYPDADIPVLPLAFVPSRSPQEQFALGAALAPLREQGVLVLGTGSITHNLRRVFAGGLRAAPDQPEIAESAGFRGWMRARAAPSATGTRCSTTAGSRPMPSTCTRPTNICCRGSVSYTHLTLPTNREV